MRSSDKTGVAGDPHKYATDNDYVIYFFGNTTIFLNVIKASENNVHKMRKQECT